MKKKFFDAEYTPKIPTVSGPLFGEKEKEENEKGDGKIIDIGSGRMSSNKKDDTPWYEKESA